MTRPSRKPWFSNFQRLPAMMAIAFILAVLWSGCKSTTRYHVLKFFFDGVPAPSAPRAVPQQPGGAPAQAVPAPAFSDHGPYAARMCQACHQQQTNALVAPANELCYQCHDLQLNKKYIHGPLSSGGCTVCHDPHSSPNRYLLVSESSTFCVRCHDASEISESPAHRSAGGQQCTDCHDAHMSDKPYLLK